jgi:MerR family transcriptional regulator, mercuric resistance operon regulatory protein
MNTHVEPTFTIGKLAEAAGVNVETVRYYERRGLIAQPASRGGYRRYGKTHLERIAFIRRAQGIGFSLDEIADLMTLNDMTDHLQARRLAEAKIATISERIAHLQQMQHALQHLVKTCKPGKPCPIIDMALDDASELSKQSPPRACHPGSSH